MQYKQINMHKPMFCRLFYNFLHIKCALPDKCENGGEIGLMFTEGPSEKTQLILYTLNKKKVKCTFIFATNSIDANTENKIKQAADEGHVVALRINPSRNYNQMDDEKDVEEDIKYSITQLEEITGKDVKYATAPLDENTVNNTVFKYLAKNDIVQLGYKFNPFDVQNKSPSEATADYLKNKNPKYDTFIIALYEMNIQDKDELNDIIAEMQKNYKIVPMTQCLKNFKP